MITKIGKVAILFISMAVLGSCGGPKRSLSDDTNSLTPPGKDTPAGGDTSANTPPNAVNAGGGTTGTPAQSGTGQPGQGPSTGSPNGAQPAPASAEPTVRFAQIKPILQNYCIQCHQESRIPTAREVNWADYNEAKPLMNTLKERVWTVWEQNNNDGKAMPLGNMPGKNTKQMTEEDRILIKKWVEGGGLE